MLRSISVLIIIVALCAVIAPSFVSAAGLVPCGDTSKVTSSTGDDDPCDFCDLFELIDRVFDFVAMKLTPVVSVVALIIGAIFMMAGGANESLKQRGKQVLTGTIIGVAIVLLSWVIIDTVIGIIADQAAKGNLAPWNSISC